MKAEDRTTSRKLSAEDMARVLHEFNATETAYPRDKLIHELIAEQAELRPNEIAVICGDAEITYGGLMRRVHSLGWELQQKNHVRPDDLVALVMERSVEMVVAMLAVLEAGGACVPIDTTYPLARIQFILNDCNSSLLLTNVDTDRSLATATQVKDLRRWQGADRDTAPPRTSDENSLIYCLYTSGSSGTPKGVLVEHVGVRNVLQWSAERLRIAPPDRMLQRTPYTFDVAFMELFVPLMCGAKLVLLAPGAEKVPEAVRDAIVRHRITVLQFVPSVLMAHLSYLDENPVGDATRCVCVGEALRAGLRDAFYRATGGKCELYNFYGPTEASIYATSSLVLSDGGEITIGKPMANVRVRILDDAFELCPVGLAGELCIAGVAVARGYLNRADQTHDRFLPDPYAPGERMYRTGDLAYWRDDGEIVYLGRRDDQVKIRGHRVEPAEVEDALSRIAPVLDTAVLSIEIDGQHELVAYFVADGSVDASALRDALSAILPPYMLPTRFIRMEALPTTPNGKLNRAALPKPDLESVEAFGEASVDPLELELCRILAAAIGRSDVRPSDRFLDMGGDSLRAVQVALRIRQILNVNPKVEWLLENQSAAQLVESIRRAGKGPLPELAPAPQSQWYALSSGQLSLWLLEQAGVPHPPYTLVNVHKLEGELNENGLRGAAETLLKSHESLRMSFREIVGQPKQRPEPVSLDWETMEVAADDGAREQFILDFTTRPFDLAAGRLIRFLLLKSSPVYHTLVVSVHHIAADGWSQSLLIDELLTYYALHTKRDDYKICPPAVQYRDYAYWQQKMLNDGLLDDSKDYWKETLGGVPERLELPTDWARPAQSHYAGAVAKRTLHREVPQSLKRFCHREHTTAYVVLCSAARALLYRYTGQEDFVLGSAAISRPLPEFHDLIGYYVNTLALRGTVRPSMRFRELVQSAQQVLLKAIQHRDYPFERIIQDLGVATGSGRNPFFDVMVLLDSGWGESSVCVDGLAVQHLPTPRRHSQIDLTLTFRESGESLEIIAEYSTELLSPARIERMLEHLEVLLKSALNDPEQQIQSLQLLPDWERRRVLVEFNRTNTVYLRDKLIPKLFEEQAAKLAEKIAVVSPEGSLTFASLNRRSNQLAWTLRKVHGVGPEVRVAVLMERSIERMVGVWAILKAGGAYVPIDVRDPISRVRDILQDSGCVVALTRGDWRAKIADEAFCTLDLLSPASYAQRFDNLPATATLTNQMYCLYTSGSTGVPKGVLIEHGAVLNRLSWMAETLAMNSGDVILHKTPSVFDVSVWEMFLPGVLGATQVLLPEGGESDPQLIRNTIRNHGVSTLHFVPSMLSHYLEACKDGFAGVRHCICSGEALSRDLARRFYSQTERSHADLYNYYGPTEAAVDVSFHRVKDTAGPVPIGPPAPNNVFYILDANGALVPIGVPGHLCIGGVQVARGYLNRPELTRRFFADDPFQPGGRIYFTGDRAAWNDEGEVLYQGRLDQQVKLRGHRIEPEEIERALSGYPGVASSVVLLHREKHSADYLCAYIESGISIPSDSLRQHLARLLPPYMIPARYVPVTSIPVTRNGKVDVLALKAMAPSETAGAALQAPSTATEKRIHDIWTALLPTAVVGIEEDFFDIGGNSLTALHLSSRLSHEFGVSLRVAAIFKYRTIAAQAVLAQELIQTEPVRTGHFRRYPRTSKHALSFAQERLWFLHVLEPGSAAYNMPLFMRLTGPLDEDALAQALVQLTERHEILRVRFGAAEGDPFQYPVSPIGAPLERYEISGASHETVWELARRESKKVFRLAEEPPLRATVFRIGETDHVLLLVLPHIVADGLSLEIAQRDLFALYSQRIGIAACLPSLPLQYIDYAESTRTQLDSMEEALVYWVRRLASGARLDLPQDAPSRDPQQGTSGRFALQLSADTIRSLKALCATTQATMFELVAATLSLLLSRLSDQTDVSIGFPVANRQSLELEGLIGIFLNTLVLRTDLSGNPAFKTLLHQVSTNAREALEHASAPFELVVERLNPPRRLEHTPVFNVLLNFMAERSEELRVQDLSVRREDKFEHDAKFDLSFYVSVVDTEIGIELIYRSDLFLPERAQIMLRQLVFLLEQVARSPNLRMASYSLILPEVEFLLPKMGDPIPAPYFPPLTEVIDGWVLTSPAHTAIEEGASLLSYRELGLRTRSIAKQLAESGCETGTVIGILGQRGIDFVCAMLGAMRVGATVLPLDAGLPVGRLRRLLQVGKPGLVMRCGALDENVVSIVSDLPHLRVDSRSALPSADAPESYIKEAGERPGPDTPAYLFFTSGTTGKPRGVLGTHGGLSHFIHWQKESFCLDATSRCAQLTNLSFDVMLRDTLLALVSGGTLVIPERSDEIGGKAIFTWLRKKKVQILHAVPALLQSWLLDAPTDLRLPDLKWMFVAGEPLKSSLAKTVQSRFPSCAIVNLYGPTETTLAKVAYRVSGAETTPIIPIGKPISFTQVHILREDMPCGVGEPGEIVIRTPFRTYGYFQDPESTQKVFLPNPASSQPDDLLYRTGDIGRYRPDGSLEILGRRDQQVKIDGVRIEPAEIECEMMTHPAVRASLVRPVKDSQDKIRLIAYVVSKETGSHFTESLRRHLRVSLPASMMPQAFVNLDAIPISPNGKPDYRALPEPCLLPPPAFSLPDVPTTTAERDIAAIWKRIFGEGEIGTADNFFDLGGTSLKLLRLFALLDERFPNRFRVAQLFTNPSIATQAAIVDGPPIPTRNDAERIDF